MGIIFRPELAAAVVEGRKTVTRRKTSSKPTSTWAHNDCKVTLGQRIAIQPGRGQHAVGYATVVGVRREMFSPLMIDDAEVAREGFPDRDAFAKTWREIHGDVLPLVVWRVEFANAEPVSDDLGGADDAR